jgi:16S rRNA processing protein RimM
VSDESTIMGKVTSVYGVKGWVKVFSYTQPKENLCKYNIWTLEQNGSQRPVKVLQCKAHGNGLVAQLENCGDREVAKTYCDSLIRISLSELPDLADDDFYWHQLEGLKVITVQEQVLGKVHHMMETGANDVLVVKKCAGSIDGRERLIPYLPEQVVKSVNLESGEILVDWDSEF